MIESYAFLALALTYEDPASDPFPGLNDVNWKKLSSQTYRYFLGLAVAVSVLTLAQTAQALVMSGDSGTQVKQIQQRLQQLGYFNANVTGYFGSLTQDAVIRFQRNAGLSADGIVGPKTLAALGLVPPVDYDTGTTNRDLIGLGIGDNGPGVSDLQRRLQALGYLTVQPTGSFGTVTENAVIRLQQDYNIPATGLVTEATLALLNSTPQPRPDILPGTTLQLGDYGSAVATLQEALQNLGFYDGSITAYFDDRTEVAVQRFQQSQGIPATGVATSATLMALNAYVPGVPRPPASPAFDTILRLGSRGPAVKVLQGQLKSLGYYNGDIDGVFGQTTQQAVINFQRDYGIVPPGEVGPTTAFYLASATTPNPLAPMIPRPIPIVQRPIPPITNSLSMVSLGDTGIEVRKIQRRLRELNYYNGPINGFFDTATQNALMRFQQSAGITVNGIAGPTTQTYLFNPRPVSVTPTRTVVAVGMAPPVSSLSNIQQLQQTLRIQGLYNGPINGIYDSSTQQAVAQARAFYGPSADTILFGGGL